ncbi:MAG: T9SS type A sorting domain-containing protein, partial [Bacteroidota bacterium]
SQPYFMIVEVKDQVKPTVTMLGENPWIIDVYTTKLKIRELDSNPIEYSDNLPGNLTTIFNYNNVNPDVLGNYVITYLVRDVAGNETVITRQVKVVDRRAPLIELIGSSTVDLFYQDTFKDLGVKIIDNYESNAKLQYALKTTTTLEVVTVGGESKWVGAKRGTKEIRYNVTDSSGNVATQVIRRVYVDFKSGLADYKTNGELSVYPNPNNGTFTIKTKEALKGSTTATIYNILGAKVHTETYEANGISTHEIVTSQLKAGVYLLHVTNNGKQFTQRVIIR